MTAPSSLGLGRYLHDDATSRLVADWTVQLADGRALPLYGSPEWQHAPRDLQIAAVLREAEAHRLDRLYLPDALAAEVDSRAWAADRQDQAEFEQLARQVRALGDGSHATHAQLQARRAQPLRPRPEIARHPTPQEGAA